jgi:hypothetical protein
MLPLSSRLAFLGIAIFTLSAAPAQASFADKVFDFLQSKGTIVGINPDQVEAARYMVRHPERGSEVLTHAVEQDYPYFALVGAVKAAKNKNFPKIGKFTEDKCVMPLTAIDIVFGKADGLIDDAAGKKKTNDVADYAKGYATNYAKQVTAEAKEQVLKEIADNVPYFRDIPTICNFGFETNFKIERNIQTIISQTVRDLKDGYNAFKKGDIGYGAEKLVVAGVKPETVCTLIDDGLSGGLIGKTPVIGDLAKGMCKSFAGKIIKGIASVAGKVADKAKEYGEDAICAVETLWGGCDDATPAPPSGISEAGKFCAPYGGVKSALSKTNQPNDYSVICNDGSMCNVKPNQKPRCASAVQIAAHKAGQIAKADADYKSGIESWSKKVDGTWLDQCLDNTCRGGVKMIKLNTTLALKQDHAKSPDTPWSFATVRLTAAEAQMQTAVDESKQRSADTNKNITKNASEGWELIMVAKWSKECLDDLCKQKVVGTAKLMKLETNLRQKKYPEKSALAIQGEVGRDFVKIFEGHVEESKKRATLKNPAASANDKMHALDCKNYLGRANQYMCSNKAAFENCKQYVNSGKADYCVSPSGGAYGAKGTVEKILASQGCQKSSATGLTFKCKTPVALKICNNFSSGGMAIACNN